MAAPLSAPLSAPVASPLTGMKVVMLGATGGVGEQVVAALQAMTPLDKLSLLNRRIVPKLAGANTEQHVVDVFAPATYEALLPGHDAAICTFGVGEPSKVTNDELVRVDKGAVMAFAAACRAAGIRHFELLGAAAADPTSRIFYLRSKGELSQALAALKFERLSIFQPSMILTPTNRYGWTQGLTLALWPKLHPLLQGRTAKYRGIRIETLGTAMAANLLTPRPSVTDRAVEILHWPEFVALAGANT